MPPEPLEISVASRKELFEFLDAQMHRSYSSLREEQRAVVGGNMIKSYVFEVAHDIDTAGDAKATEDLIRSIFGAPSGFSIKKTDEAGFYDLRGRFSDHSAQLFIDTATNPRFWAAFSVSKARTIDQWLDRVSRKSSAFDYIWLWPEFLEDTQRGGIARGFGLDYDYRKFDDAEEEITTYLKMQIWGGADTARLYDLLRKTEFKEKIVLSKVRFKKIRDADLDVFALEDLKYQGKFTVRGSDFTTHLSTLSDVRKRYQFTIEGLEDHLSIKWTRRNEGGVILEGFAINFFPRGRDIPVIPFCENVMNGTQPWQLMGIAATKGEHAAHVDAVDLHTGGKLSFAIYPDLISVFMPEGTCGNTIARFYTNLQHYFSSMFTVESDDGSTIF